MTTQQLRDLLGDVPDTREIVLAAHQPAGDGLTAAWHAAHDEATAALRAWSAVPGSDGYAAYRAAEDRADAAQDALGQRWAG